MAERNSAPAPSHCPFCGQPLVDRAAVAHLERAQAAMERKLRAELAAETQTQIREQVTAAKRATDEAAATRTAALEEQLREHKAEIAALKQRRSGERVELEAQIREQTRKDFDRRQKAVQRTLETLREQKEELERRVEHLSAQDRGDLNEIDTMQRLRAAFPSDHIEKKGRGGDILHTVLYSVSGVERRAGLILYECKDTAKWSNDFLAQVKRDGQTHKTPYLVLVTRAMPRGEKVICIRDGVVVVQPAHVVYLAELLRRMAVETNEAEQGGKGQREKTAALYEYLASRDFRDSFAAVVHAGDALSEMLRTEKQAHERTWTRREHAYADLARRTTAIDESLQAIFAGDKRRHNGKVVALR